MIDAQTLTAVDLAALLAEIPDHVDDAKAQTIQNWPVRSNRASEIGHECERYLTYNRVAWRLRPLYDVGLQYIFDEGRRQEQHALEDLRAAGYAIVEGQRGFEWAAKQITGMIDGKIMLPKGHPRPRAVAFDVKSVNPWDFDRYGSVEDLLGSPHPWMRRIPAQIMAYLVMNAAEEVGAVFLRNKSTGRLKVIPVHLDYALAESLVAKAERVNQTVALITAAGGIPDSGIVPAEVEALLPPRIPYDQETCGRCAFFHLCLPDQHARGTADLETDPEFLALLARRDDLQPMSREYERVDRAIKDRVGERERVVAGDWLITRTMRSRKAYSVDAGEYPVVKIDRLGPVQGPGDAPP